ncbi:LOW QUALITY PROTEIN: acyl-coenzyme A synthetase ACSM5, mitochondrial [Rhynchonycteris naso]
MDSHHLSPCPCPLYLSTPSPHPRETVSLGRQQVPESFHFACDVQDVCSQLEKGKPALSCGVHLGHQRLPSVPFGTLRTKKHVDVDVWTWEFCESYSTGHQPPLPAFCWVKHTGADVKWSFEKLRTQTRKAAHVLGGKEACDLQPGDRMTLVLPRVPAWWLISVVSMRTGQ